MRYSTTCSQWIMTLRTWRKRTLLFFVRLINARLLRTVRSCLSSAEIYYPLACANYHTRAFYAAPVDPFTLFCYNTNKFIDLYNSFQKISLYWKKWRLYRFNLISLYNIKFFFTYQNFKKADAKVFFKLRLFYTEYKIFIFSVILWKYMY